MTLTFGPRQDGIAPHRFLCSTCRRLVNAGEPYRQQFVSGGPTFRQCQHCRAVTDLWNPRIYSAWGGNVVSLEGFLRWAYTSPRSHAERLAKRGWRNQWTGRFRRLLRVPTKS